MENSAGGRDSWASSTHARLTMQANRGRDTRPELLVRRALHARGWRYRVNHRPLASDRRRTVDIAFTRQRLAVLIDGCFWHRCPEHFVMPKTNLSYWEEKISGNVRRDTATNSLLEEEGWTVLRFWEHQDPAAVVEEVEASLRELS